MKKTIDYYDFVQGFVDCDRDYFSNDGYSVLFDYITEIEEDTGNEIEFDPIAIVCDFTEYDGIEMLEQDYGYIYSREEYMTDNDITEEDFDDSEYCEELASKLEYYTTVLYVSDCDYIVGCF